MLVTPSVAVPGVLRQTAQSTVGTVAYGAPDNVPVALIISPTAFLVVVNVAVAVHVSHLSVYGTLVILAHGTVTDRATVRPI